MGEDDSVSVHRDTVKIEGGRNLYNYTFTIRDTSYEDLIHLIDSGDSKRVLQFLEGHPHVPMHSDSSPFTPLHFAAKVGDANIVRALAERGAPLDVEDGQHDSTPLGWAAFFGRPAAAEALLKAGARVTANALENAKAGISGSFSDFSNATPDDYRAVLTLLEKGTP